MAGQRPMSRIGSTKFKRSRSVWQQHLNRLSQYGAVRRMWCRWCLVARQIGTLAVSGSSRRTAMPLYESMGTLGRTEWLNKLLQHAWHRAMPLRHFSLFRYAQSDSIADSCGDYRPPPFSGDRGQGERHDYLWRFTVRGKYDTDCVAGLQSWPG